MRTKLLLSLYFLSFNIIATGQQIITYIKKVDNDKLYLKVFSENREAVIVSTANLRLIDSLKSKYNYHVEYNNVGQISFREYLLFNGYAQIVDTLKATKDELTNQKLAQEEKKGIWISLNVVPKKIDSIINNRSDSTFNNTLAKKPSEIDSTNRTNNTSLSETVPSFFSKNAGVLSLLFGSGLLVSLSGFIFKFAQKRYRSRKINLLFIGEPSAGKTALFKHFTHPNAPESFYSSPNPPSKIKATKIADLFAIGKYEITPTYTDTPGSKIAAIWDEFCEKHNVIVYVLAPVSIYSMNNKPDNYVDELYTSEQYGVLRTFLGALNSLKLNIKKPKLIILYLNKFDLYSNNRPSDSSSEYIVEKYNKIFLRHIAYAKEECQKANVPFEVVINSSHKKWGVREEIVHHISNKLYN